MTTENSSAPSSSVLSLDASQQHPEWGRRVLWQGPAAQLRHLERGPNQCAPSACQPWLSATRRRRPGWRGSAAATGWRRQQYPRQPNYEWRRWCHQAEEGVEQAAAPVGPRRRGRPRRRQNRTSFQVILEADCLPRRRRLLRRRQVAWSTATPGRVRRPHYIIQLQKWFNYIARRPFRTVHTHS